jgi:environmental stress-induced protein Ves
MSPVLLRAADRTDRPWKDGGGLTSEIAAWPPGADMTGFAWRVSTATVTGPGPFSRFAGVDRTLAVLSGKLDLRVAGQAARLLTTADAPFAFAGDADCFGCPIDGPVRDLNVMVRRSSFTAAVRRVADERILVDADDACLLVATGAAAVTIEGQAHHLGSLDALLMQPRLEGWAASIVGGGVFVTILRGAPRVQRSSVPKD